MSQSYHKWKMPAHVGEWTLDLDDRQHPSEATIWRSGLMIARLPYRGLNDQLIDELAFQTAISPGTAAKLVAKMAMKCASHWTRLAVAS